MIKITGLLYKENNETFSERLERRSNQPPDKFKAESDSYAEAAWKYTLYNEVYLYDLDEQIYKKRKVYFHVSDKPFKNIDARTAKFRSVPAAFFAMDFRTCIDFFKYKFGDNTPAFMHRCVNNRPMNLFNPVADSDVASLNLDPHELYMFNTMVQRAKAEGKNSRYWHIMETEFLHGVYTETKCDGMALDFYKQGTTSWKDRTEGFCLFDRGVSAMKVIDIAPIDKIPKLPIDPKKLTFYVPGSKELQI